MEIFQVVDELVCTRRVPGLKSAVLRVLRDQKGGIAVATDPVSAPVGAWVFATAGTAARVAMPDPALITDLTICGIIDEWPPPELRAPQAEPAG
ncbi:MAG: carboxysome peptide B [Hydrogenophilus sp.]|nr:carboxysome peptide B [Hydrogenophilus sp.]